MYQEKSHFCKLFAVKCNECVFLIDVYKLGYRAWKGSQIDICTFYKKKINKSRGKTNAQENKKVEAGGASAEQDQETGRDFAETKEEKRTL